MGPYTAYSCCCQVPSISWVPVRPPFVLSTSPHSAMCHFQVSSLSCWFPFCHRLLYGLPLLSASTATTVASKPTGFGPVSWPK
ncbi:unnamed protein product [Staurois parvus]|uniref:Uncharacterized protein n=1 Tax=Staurois parvus TaxID=386267 RepID=A0ABN9E5K6_9NEOB|nr:unnamed protein product [Staurois parvus]